MNTNTLSTPLGLSLLTTLVLTACPSDDVSTVTSGDSGTSGSGSATNLTTMTTAVTTVGVTATGATATGMTGTGGDTTTGDETLDGTTSAEFECGNGIVEADEDCDDAGESDTCNVDCTSAACGDGVYNAAAGEQCDDGGESDTCNVDCTSATCGDGIYNATAGEECDDGGRTLACNADCTNASCGDGVTNMVAGEACDDAGESAACNADCSISLCGDGITNISAGENCDDMGESVTCDADCTTPACGDGVLNISAGEACDDGGESAACNADCTVATCGDGVVNAAAGEACDDSGESAVCNADCSAANCGDGVVNMTAGEVCDDMGESAACNADCTVAVCGDGVLNMAAGETCDDMGESAACDIDCTDAICGDAVINLSAGETCDDGNTLTECLPGCTPCPANVIFEENFLDNAAGWTLDTEWEIGATSISAGQAASCGNADPEFDNTPTADNGVAGAVLGGNISTSLHDFYYLTSPVIDTSGYAALELGFWRWLNSDYTPYMQNRVEVWDGVAWQTVFQTEGSPGVQDAAWTNVSYDVGAYANPAMQFRVGFNVDDGGAFTCSGWNIDDVTLSTGLACPPAAADCGGGATQVSTNPAGTMMVCNDETDVTCEEDFGTLCPAGWDLCSQPQQNNRNDGWDLPVGGGAEAALGAIHCRAGGGAGHFSVGPYDAITNINQDAALNCGYGSSRASCPSGFGCNETAARALCCAPDPLCGNGVVDGVEEECDDGDLDNENACLNNCAWRVPTANGLSGTGC